MLSEIHTVCFRRQPNVATDVNRLISVCGGCVDWLWASNLCTGVPYNFAANIRFLDFSLRVDVCSQGPGITN